MQLYIRDNRGSVIWTYFAGEENRNVITLKDQIKIIKFLTDALQAVSHKHPRKE